MAGKHTLQELQMLQALPLEVKVKKTQQRIRDWVNEYGKDGVYVSFSGGKDSTVLLHIVRGMYGNDIPAVFVNTGLEYPEIVTFVKSFENVVMLRPKLTFKQVIEKYGYPFFGKEIAGTIYGARKYLTTHKDELNHLTNERTNERTNEQYLWAYADLFGIDRRSQEGKEAYAIAKEGNIPSEFIENASCRLQILLGRYKHKEKGVQTDEYSQMYDKRKYKFMLDADFEVSDACCKVMKKAPLHKYNKESGRVAITAQMASESKLRTKSWLNNGCNGFNLKYPISNPMSFWTEQDVLLYIKQNDIPICEVYGEIVPDESKTGEPEGQLTLFDWDKTAAESELFDLERPLLKTTGCDRTGCMFCGFGAHCRGDERFVLMKETHPKQYAYIMKPWEEGGLNYKAVIDWINEHGKLNIKY